MQRSPSTQSESSKEAELLKGIALIMENCGDFSWDKYLNEAAEVLDYLRSKGVINNG